MLSGEGSRSEQDRVFTVFIIGISAYGDVPGTIQAPTL
jgi:hypothetical protein